ncbi:MAG: HDIG domain-containing protein [Clostridiales bacterium]|nr:HDIG domain-containing protein [Clostridiales bacterium]
MKTISRADKEKAAQLFSRIEEHLLSEEKPSAALKEMLKAGDFDSYPFSMLKKLGETEQSPVHHPEGNVWNHTLLVVDEAAKRRQESSDTRAFMWAALLHDIGKPATTRSRKGRITAYDHDKIGAELAEEFLSAVTEDRRLIEKVTQLVKYHMQILYVINNLPFKDIAGMKRHSDIREVALLCLCDRLGRPGVNRDKEEAQIKMFISICENQ